MTPALATLELNLQTNVSNAQVLPVATRSLREIAHQPKIDCQVLHSLPGRLRLGIPKLAGDTTYSEKLTYALQSLPWIGEVRINPAASCAIINYQSHPSSESEQQAAILAIVQEADSLALLSTTALEAVEAELGSFWDQFSGELQNFLTGYEGIGKEILKAIAIASLIIGIAGVILPLLLGTPFLLLSHFCFLACS